ncbi:protein IMPAIRED IN BABA-INDUCED STERILITY 1 [Sesamum angolense]|uniref:Protein IMPAIRED IN BABA-INDUCED STERILITY 1 n=1 Tax=Sesamum angolense TaxID=2727404 RepID=A0AAE1W101_9LAMI|nr:protein IMPAIRED IN BABA-INDUCED STERILITY 1 [Sesamum angolense]
MDFSSSKLKYFKTKHMLCDHKACQSIHLVRRLILNIMKKASRKKTGGRSRGPETRKPARKQNGINKLAPEENLAHQMQGERKMNRNGVTNHRGDKVLGQEPPKPSTGSIKEASHVKNASQGDDTYSGLYKFQDQVGEENCEVVNGQFLNTKGHDSYETIKRSMQWSQLERPDSFDASDGYHSQELSVALYHKEEAAAKRINVVFLRANPNLVKLKQVSLKYSTGEIGL